jgi:hypothetical protein
MQGQIIGWLKSKRNVTESTCGTLDLIIDSLISCRKIDNR